MLSLSRSTPHRNPWPLVIILGIAIFTAVGGAVGAMDRGTPPTASQPPPTASAAPRDPPTTASQRAAQRPTPTLTGPVRVNVLGGDSRWEGVWISRVLILVLLLGVGGVATYILTAPRHETAIPTRSFRRRERR